MTTARTLTCPQCGAAAAPESHACAFCRARLATVACPGCFGLVFVGSRHCVHCGAQAKEPRALDGTPWRCPSGHGELRGVGLGGAELGECPECAGLWLDERTFQRVVAERERPAVVPQGGAAPARPKPARAEPVRYRKCPDCGKVMNRVNFAKSSGIIIDACRGHGVWCDADELRLIVEFVASGGLDASRAKEREMLSLERGRLAFMQGLDSATTTQEERAHRRTPIFFPALARDRDDAAEKTGLVIGAGLGLLISLLND